MPEGFSNNNDTNKDKEMEMFLREKYEDFRKEILAFKDLPESTFSNQRDNMGPITPAEARKLHGHGIMNKINNFFGDTSHDKEKRRLHFELVRLWEKEIMGMSGDRKMYNEDGSEFLM